MSKKISELTSLSSPATGDLVPVVDISDTTQAASGSTKKFTLQVIADFLASLTQTLTNKTLTTPTLTSPVINTGVSGTAIVDEDDMASDSATKVPTQQSVKAYVDTNSPTPTQLNDTSGNEAVKTVATGSAVNEITVTNAASGGKPKIAASGDGTNIHLTLNGKGNGLVELSMLQQDTTPTNTYRHNIVTLIGQTSVTLGSGASEKTQAVTFGLTFSALYYCNMSGIVNGAGILGAATEWPLHNFNDAPGNSGFTAHFITRSSTWGGNRATSFFWEAKGSL